jgi:hypothetical protein
MQMFKIREGFKRGLTVEQVKIYAKPEIHHYLMSEIQWCLTRSGLITEDKIKSYVELKFNGDQIYQIRRGFENGLSDKQVELYAKPEFEDDQMRAIRSGFEEDGLTIEQAKVFAKPEFNRNQMDEIKQGFKNALPMDKVMFYADTKFNAEQMRAIRKCFESCLEVKFANELIAEILKKLIN